MARRLRTHTLDVVYMGYRTVLEQAVDEWEDGHGVQFVTLEENG